MINDCATPPYKVSNIVRVKSLLNVLEKNGVKSK